MSDHATSFTARLEHLFHHLSHRLPGQAPIRDFVHHNTLHGYQHLPFEEALRQVRKETGIYGFLPLEQSRSLYQKGRITPEALREEIFSRTELQAEEHLAILDDGPLKQADIYATALIHDLSPLKPDQLAWQIHELRAGEIFQADIPPTIRHRLLHSADAVEEVAIAQLWSACHHLLPPPPHPLISHEPLEDVLWQGQPRHEARRTMERLFQQVGREITLGSLVKRLTGHAPLEEGKTNLQSHLASFLDHGLAAWHHPARQQGFYAAWRQAALHDLAFLPEEMPTWREEIASFPEDAVATLQEALRRSGVAEELWISYLEALALELPGWSGMVLWRHHHEGYAGLPRVHFADYLAVRLLLERLHLHRICHHLWQEEPRLDILYNHFRHREAEFMVRYTLFNESLPESLATPCQAMVARAEETMVDELLWTQLAYGIWRFRQGMRAEGVSNDWVCHRIWPLFRLAQHLGLSARELHRLREEPLQKVLACLDRLDDETMGMIWLQAYERTYRQSIFNAIRHGGQKEQTSNRPSLQAVFCMDDREEGFRRHLEEIAPSVETFGAAGFFGVPIYWRGLDDEKEVALCPIVVTPRHAIHEIPKEDQQDRYQLHRKRRRTRLNALEFLNQGSRRGVVTATLLTLLAAPLAFFLTIARILAPRQTGSWLERMVQKIDLSLSTTVTLNRSTPPSDKAVVLGFSDEEQAQRVETLLRIMGMTRTFAPWVILLGHGSMSRNNPHLAAYDCGACSGRHGGPNARVFAAMANRPEVRSLLAEKGINIPADCRFIGAEHNTGDETIQWYDLEQLSPQQQEGLQPLLAIFNQAREASAHERCRRLASAPRHPSLSQALLHMQGRALDFSQARPELGHATNAVALVGRRSTTRGTFFDRRMYLISYDPQQDRQGTILESILLAVGPVGAGINLEYYFSTVDNQRFGCGSKITHNVVGLFGVMEGTASDLRTGLPKQMIEIHEAMRLLVVVEHTPQVLTAICERQAAIRELVEHGWLLLASLHPDNRQIEFYQPGKGWQPWQEDLPPPPRVANSMSWYHGHQDPLPPALIGEVSHV